MSILNLGLLLAAAAPHASPLPPAAALVRQDVVVRLQALMEEYSKAERAFYQRLQELGDSAEGQRLFKENPLPAFIARFRELAYDAAGSETGVTAWVRVFDFGLRFDRGEDVREAMDVLLADHLDSPQLRALAETLPYATGLLGSETVRSALETLHGKAGSVAVRASAQYSLATLLMQSAAEGDKARGRELFEDMLTRYAEAEGDWAARAKGMLFELDHLQVGMNAPDFEAVDADGVAWKLSDYRGKVVIVDFWGFW